MTSYFVERWDGGAWGAWYPWGRHKQKAIEHCKKANKVRGKFRVVRIRTIKSVVYTPKA